MKVKSDLQNRGCARLIRGFVGVLIRDVFYLTCKAECGPASSLQSNQTYAFKDLDVIVYYLFALVKQLRYLFLGHTRMLLDLSNYVPLESPQVMFLLRYFHTYGIKPLVDSIPQRLDEPFPLQHLKMVCPDTILQAEMLDDGIVMFTGIRLDITENLTSDEMAQHVLLLQTHIQR